MSQPPPPPLFRGQWVRWTKGATRIGQVLNSRLGKRCLVRFTDRDYPTIPLKEGLKPLFDDEEWTE